MTSHDRVPPGQTATAKWPVLTYGDVPQIDTARWRFRIWGAVESPRQWTWVEISALPVVESQSDIHCVTRWSRLDNHWRGVRPRDLLAAARPRPEARYVMVHAEPDYTTNLPLEALLDDDVILATHHDGRPLAAAAGGTSVAVKSIVGAERLRRGARSAGPGVVRLSDMHISSANRLDPAGRK